MEVEITYKPSCKYPIPSGYLPGYLPVLPPKFIGKTGKYPGKYPEAFFFIPTVGYMYK